MIRWGPWRTHDGGGAPPELRKGDHLEAIVEIDAGGSISPPEHIWKDWPGWFWRKRRMRVPGLAGWFVKGPLRAVCDDPAYRAILRYRIGRHILEQGNLQARMLAKIAEQGLPMRLNPEGPSRKNTKEDAE